MGIYLQYMHRKKCINNSQSDWTSQQLLLLFSCLAAHTVDMTHYCPSLGKIEITLNPQPLITWHRHERHQRSTYLFGLTHAFRFVHLCHRRPLLLVPEQSSSDPTWWEDKMWWRIKVFTECVATFKCIGFPPVYLLTRKCSCANINVLFLQK